MSEMAVTTDLKIPNVAILDAIKPDNAGTGEATLRYEDLEDNANTYKRYEEAYTDAFWEQEPGTLEEEFKARQLAFQYLVRIAHNSVDAPTPAQHDLWASRFTEGAVELYGAPDFDQAKAILSHEYAVLLGSRGDRHVNQGYVEFLLHTYDQVIARMPGEFTHNKAETPEREIAAIAAYGEAMRESFQPIFDLVDDDKEHYDPAELQALFTDAIDWMAEHDNPNWEQWVVKQTKGTKMSVHARPREIRIGKQRALATPGTTRKLLAHELIGHARRHNNGYLTDDGKLATGYTGYMMSDEGLGKLHEHAISGEIPEESAESYLNIALALGTLDGVERNRPTLINIVLARNIVKEQVKRGDTNVNQATLQQKAFTSVDNIYRGGRGDAFGTRAAVFTNNAMYYAGYCKMARYIADEIEGGKSAKEVFDYLSQGSFDPTDERHIQRLAQAKRTS